MEKKVDESKKDDLKRIKKNVEKAVTNFKENNKRFHEYQKITFESALTEDDRAILDAYDKPDLEFNIINPPVSRLCGEFSKQEPSIYVTPANGAQVDPQMINIVEGHIRHILFEAKKKNVQYMVYRDQLSGGFSYFKVWTEYAHETSFDQVIKFDRVWEPTLSGFDPMARLPDKSDAEYCYEFYPMTKEVFKATFPDVNIDDISYAKDSDVFNWCYNNGQEDIIIVCNYYEKVRETVKVVNVVGKGGMTEAKYEELLKQHKESGDITQPPAIIGKAQKRQIVTTKRIQFIDTQEIEEKEIGNKNLNLIFVDGDSVIIREGESGSFKQFTKPYVYHAKGIQRLTNFAGQVIANDFESMVMHKFKVAAESLPEQEDYRQAYENVQKASVLIYNAYDKDDPNKQLPPPQEIARIPLPQEVLATFNNSMQMLQNILGSYDASLGINDNQLSGVAIVEAASQSNAAAMPYIVNYMQSLNRVAQNILEMIPKCYRTPRTIPVTEKDGKISYVKINQPGGIDLNYDTNDLQIQVEAGVNFNIARNRALQQIIALMNASPLFAQFINSEGLDILLDNIEFRGVDVIKSRADAFMKKIQEAQAKAQNQPSPEQMQAQAMQGQLQIEQQKVQQKAQETQINAQLKAEEIMVNRAKVDNDRLAIMQKAGESEKQLVVGLAKAEAEEQRARADLHMNHKDMVHRQTREAIELHHTINQAEKESENATEKG